MKSLICLIGLMLAGCGGGGAYTACQYEAGGQMHDSATGVAYYVDGSACTLRSVDTPGAGCQTMATVSPSEKTYAPVTLTLNVKASLPKAGCFPTGQYTCERAFLGGGTVTYSCGAQGNFTFVK